MPTDTRRLEELLTRTIDRLAGPGCPPKLAQALRHAVLVPGNRLRPRLCLAVARAVRPRPSRLADAAAIAVEFMHCASLVQDDLPCFDDAPVRRGQPSVQRLVGEPVAILCADGLIVAAFEVLADAALADAAAAARIAAVLARAAGSPEGMAAGQAWENEPDVELTRYHRAKTAALFEAAAAAGALAAGARVDGWREVGRRLGEAYQIADDLMDAHGDAGALGKPTGRDAALHRPSAVDVLGATESMRRFEESATAALAAVPPCPGAERLRGFLRAEFDRLAAAIGGPPSAAKIG